MKDGRLVLAFDLGGVISKFPAEFVALIHGLQRGNLMALQGGVGEKVELHIISDMKPHAKAVAFTHDNGINIPSSRIHVADYDAHGECCKAEVCDRLGVDILIDDFPGYVALPGRPPVRLLVMPDPHREYFHMTWRTDGSEGNFGRRRQAAVAPPPATPPGVNS